MPGMPVNPQFGSNTSPDDVVDLGCCAVRCNQADYAPMEMTFM
jgi:hypothetical protein